VRRNIILLRFQGIQYLGSHLAQAQQLFPTFQKVTPTARLMEKPGYFVNQEEKEHDYFAVWGDELHILREAFQERSRDAFFLSLQDKQYLEGHTHLTKDTRPEDERCTEPHAVAVSNWNNLIRNMLYASAGKPGPTWVESLRDITQRVIKPADIDTTN
jgi:hypothetical protein